MKLLSLRVKRNSVGKTFPFDRVYLARHEDRAVFGEIFRYALILPYDGELKEMFEATTAEFIVKRGMERDDDATKTKALLPGQWRTLMSSEQWVIAVPLNAKYLGTVNKELPRYLVSPKWYAGRRGENRTEKSVFSKDSYLQTPSKNIRPICLACPRIFEHYTNKCKLGDAVCYSSMGLGQVSYFNEGLTPPLAPLTPDDEEVRGKLVQLGGV